MGAQKILLAGSEPEMVAEINRALGPQWEATLVDTEADALVQLETNSFDALLVDFNMGSPDASELLNQALEKRPDTLRFLLAYEADLALVAAKVLGTPEILPKPVEAASLKSRIENAVNGSDAEDNRSEAAAAAASPAIPAIYSEVLNALESPDATPAQIAEIIASDAELTAEVLSLTKSAYRGLPHNLTNPAEAVESLGLDAVKVLMLARRFLAENSRLKPGYLSLELLWEHSVNVARIARDLMLLETKDSLLASDALAAGLLHDLGKVVLVTNFDDLYGRVHSLARKQPVPLWEIEKEMFGANHGEIGACLVGMWNIPRSIVEAAALHHEPPLGEHEELTPLAAVHVANVLEHQVRGGDEFRVTPMISTPLLNELGLLQRLPVWYATFASRSSANFEPDAAPAGTEQSVVESGTSSRTASHLHGHVERTRTSNFGEQSDDSNESAAAGRASAPYWLYSGVALAAILFLCLWFETQWGEENSIPVHARTLGSAPAPQAWSPSAETPAAVAPEVASAPAVSAPEGATGASSVPEPAIWDPEAVIPATASGQAVTNAPAALPKKVAPEFRLTGIIYTVAQPSAILNGRTVYVGDHVNGATIISISPTELTLETKGRRKIFSLP